MRLANFLRLLALTLALSGYSAWVLAQRDPAKPQPYGEADGIPLLRLADAEVLWRDDSTVFVDVRSPIDYEFGHVAGAISLPEEAFEEQFPALRYRLERAGAIVVYCKNTDCGKSLWAAIRLRNAGLSQTCIYPAGWNEWYLEGRPTAGTGR